MRIKTLKGRLLLASIFILPLVLGFTGFALDKAFRQSLNAAERVRLERYFYLLFSLAELETVTLNTGASSQQLSLPETLLEPDLEQPTSGVLAWVFDATGNTIWRSNSSLLMTPLPSNELFSKDLHPGELHIQQLLWSDNNYFFANFDVLWEDDNDQDVPYRFALLHSQEDYFESLKAYHTQLWRGLGTLAILLLLAQAGILIWALAPLGRITAALKKMHQGDTTALNESYPRELQQVADSLNAVLERETALRIRYRNSLGDLAHSLKTPLAVLQSSQAAAESGEYKKLVDEQVKRMSQVVSYQLQRAVAFHQSGGQQRCLALDTIEKLNRTLQKIYHLKNMKITVDVDPVLYFIGDEQDLLEALGNILDNAFKYGNQALSISSQVTSSEQGDLLKIFIEDDGIGINETKRSEILERGKRLDTSMPGQGIGLSVATDIIASYHGALNISESKLGGACFIITLPSPAFNIEHSFSK